MTPAGSAAGIVAAGLVAAGLVAAGPAHADALAAIHQAAFPPDAAWGPQVMALQLGLPGAFGWIDPRGGMVLARVAADEAEILTLAVAPDARRRGLGRALLAAAMVTARGRGARMMFLEVASLNAPARMLYERAGFAEVGRRRRYYPSGDDALVLRADLVAPDAP